MCNSPEYEGPTSLSGCSGYDVLSGLIRSTLIKYFFKKRRSGTFLLYHQIFFSNPYKIEKNMHTIYSSLLALPSSSRKTHRILFICFSLQQAVLKPLPVPDSLWERQLLYTPKQRTGYWLPLSPMPWQCCTVIDKVDKEMLGHAPDRLDLKSPGCRTAAARQHTLSPLTISGLQKMSGSSVGTERNVIFSRFVCFGLSCL